MKRSQAHTSQRRPRVLMLSLLRTWARVLVALSRTRWWAQGPVALAFVLLSPLLLLNLLAIKLESWLRPGLRQLEETLDEQFSLVFVVGHQRSATTNVQNALVASLRATGREVHASDNLDLLGASLFAKLVLAPVRVLIDLLLRALVDTANHRMDADAALEEVRPLLGFDSAWRDARSDADSMSHAVRRTCGCCTSAARTASRTASSLRYLMCRPPCTR